MSGQQRTSPNPLPAEVIITHSGADFDGLASMICAHKLYPAAVPLLTGSPEASVRAFLMSYGKQFAIEQAHAVHRMPLRRVVLVDVQVPARLGEFREVVTDPDVEVHIYDHHPPTEEGIRGDVHVIERVGATTTILATRLMERKGGPPSLTPMEATLLALGVYEETGGLTFPETTPQDARVVAWLLEQGANLAVVAEFMQQALREEQHNLLRTMLGRMETRDLRGMRILIATAETDEYVGEAAVVAHRLMDLERPHALFCVLRMRDRVYVVARSRETGPDVAAILAHLGGGGHPRAASASLPAWPAQELVEVLPPAEEGRFLDSVVGELWDAIYASARPPLSAREVMSTPVQAIHLRADGGPSVDEAQHLFVRYGHSVLPVLKEERLAGMLTRRDVDKALGHNLGKTSVAEYLGAPLPTASPDVAVHELNRMMVGPGTNCVVITENGRVCGIVTRTDVLEALHLQEHPPEVELEALERLRALPRGVQDLLRRCGEVGDAMETQVYVVGGFVRDVILGWENLDVDIVAEGDGIAYARALAKELGGHASVHEKFRTAVVVANNAASPTMRKTAPVKIDVASTRLEFYTRPAALPEVTRSTLKQDLFRRDFTINAMAIQLNAQRYGRLVDFFGARRDLREGLVRVLHNLSLIDDPTRILRAIKFEQRYHFRMDPHTERLLRQAVHSRMLEALSPTRVRDEFVQILSEARPVPAIVRMAELGVLRLIHPRLQFVQRVRALLDAVTAVLAQYADMVRHEGVECWLIYFRALISGLDASGVHEVAERYRVPGEARRRLLLEREQVRHTLRRLYRAKLLPSEIYRLLTPLSLEMALYLLARARARSVKEKLVLYLDHLRTVKPLVRGRELLAWGFTPGPPFGALLRRLFDAQLDGKFRDVEEARAWLEEEEIVAAWT